MAPAFGQVQSAIVVATDKEAYMGGEVIMISGTVRDQFPTDVSVTVKAPNGNVVYVDQVPVGLDRTFSAEFTASGLTNSNGTYTITVQYTDVHSASASFELTDVMVEVEGVTVGPSEGTVPVTGNEELLVGYELSTGDILSITPNPEDSALEIAIDTIEDGTLTITIPRTVADAKNADDTDAQYFVLIDGSEVDEFEETVTDESRTLTIEFYAGAELIGIYGTFVIPEFGTIAAMILAVAVVAIIAVSARSRLSIIPRY